MPARWSISRHSGVRIPAALVERSLQQAGKQFTLYGRDLNKTAPFGQGARNYNSIAGEALWLDAVGEQRRYPTLADVATAARLGDALEQLTIVGAMADPHELPVSSRCVEVMVTMLAQTTKPIHFWYHDRASAKYLNDVMIAVRGDEARAAKYPLCYPFLETNQPVALPA